MTPRLWLPVLVVLAAAPRMATAQDCNPAGETQPEMNACAHQDYEKADKALNEAYAAVVAIHKNDNEAIGLLKSAQRSWIKFRDAECEFETIDSKGGSIRPLLRSQCLTGLTEARTRQLRKIVE